MPESLEADIRAELTRILASEPFRASDSARRFLTFVVEEKLAGRSASIKELVIGREVFGRGEDFDPRIDPVARVQAGKLRTRLKEYYDGPGAGAALTIDLPKGTYVPEFRPSTSPTPPLHRPYPRQWIAVACAAAVTCLAIGYWLGRPRSQPPAGPDYQLSVPLPPGFVHVSWPVISPNGQWLVFTGQKEEDSRKLWLVDLTTQALRPVAGAEQGTYPFWSPDSRSIGFAEMDKGTIEKVPVEGGVPHRLAQGLGLRCRGASANTGGELLYAESVGPIHWIGSPGATARAVTSLNPGEYSHRHPVFLPDGHRFLYFAATRQSATGAIWAADTRSATRKKITETQSNAMLSGGHLYFVRDGVLVRARFQLNSLEIHDIVPVAPVEFSADLNIGYFSVSDHQSVVWSPVLNQRQLAWVDRTGKLVEVIHDRGTEQVSLARGARKLAFTVLDPRTNSRDVWSFDLAGHAVTRETHPPGWHSHPVISMDARQMVLSADRGGGLDLFLHDVGGLGPGRPLLPQPSPHRYASDWSRDGKWLLFTQQNAKTRQDIWIVPIDNPTAARPLLATPYQESQAQFSPDGRWIAYTSNESGTPQVYVMPLGGGLHHQVSLKGGQAPRWRGDGRELFFLSPKGMSSVEVRTQPSWSAGHPQELFVTTEGVGYGPTSDLGYDVSADGTLFVLSMPESRNFGFTVRVPTHF
ncbi:MAG: hypothetical protein U0R19_14580 [Bryobacteraceae bacterium]